MGTKVNAIIKTLATKMHPIELLLLNFAFAQVQTWAMHIQIKKKIGESWLFLLKE